MFRCVRAACLFSILFLSGVGSTNGQQWTRFRGPDGSGETDAVDIPAVWTPQDTKWRVKLPGIGHSSPVVWGDRIYVSPPPWNRTLPGYSVASMLRTGGLYGRQTFPSKPHPKNGYNNYAAPTPTVDEHRVYFTWATPAEYILAALDRQTRARGVAARLRALRGSNMVSGPSPTLFDDLVIVPNDQNGKSSVIGVECATGKTRWTAPRAGIKAAYSTPVLYRPEGGLPQLILTTFCPGVQQFSILVTGRQTGISAY